MSKIFGGTASIDRKWDRDGKKREKSIPDFIISETETTNDNISIFQMIYTARKEGKKKRDHLL